MYCAVGVIERGGSAGAVSSKSGTSLGQARSAAASSGGAASDHNYGGEVSSDDSEPEAAVDPRRKKPKITK